MKRSVSFNKAVDKPQLTIKQDSRFMIPRHLVVNPEKPSIKTYTNPGKDMHTAAI